MIAEPATIAELMQAAGFEQTCAHAVSLNAECFECEPLLDHDPGFEC